MRFFVDPSAMTLRIWASVRLFCHAVEVKSWARCIRPSEVCPLPLRAWQEVHCLRQVVGALGGRTLSWLPCAAAGRGRKSARARRTNRAGMAALLRVRAEVTRWSARTLPQDDA